MRTSADRGLQPGIEHINDAAVMDVRLIEGKTEVADQLVQPRQPAQIFIPFGFGKLHQQHRGRRTAHEGVDGRTKHRDLAGQFDHGAIDELDRDRVELDDVLSRIHGAVKAAEVAGADGAAAEERRELELNAGRERERALGTDQDVRKIEIVAGRDQSVEVVPADPPLHLRETGRDLIGLARRRSPAGLPPAAAALPAGRRDPSATGPKCAARAVGQHGVDRKHVLADVAVAQRAGAAGVIAHHAADGRARGGRDINRKPKAVGLEPRG